MQKISRAEKAGIATGRTIIEIVELMYQNNTALNFMKGLRGVVDTYHEQRVLLSVYGKKKSVTLTVPEFINKINKKGN